MHHLISPATLLLVAILATTALAQVPQPSAEYTNKNYRQDHAAFMRNVVIEPYKKHTKDRGQTREKVLQFLEAFCDLMVNENGDEAVLKKLGQEARSAGSQDPQFLAHYCYFILEDKPSFQELSNTTLEQLRESPYPDFTTLKLRIWQMRSYKWPARRKWLIKDLKMQLILAFKEKESSDQRFIWRQVQSAFTLKTAELRDVVTAVEGAQGIDPWLKSMFIAQAKYELAWEVRGDNYAREVPEEAWTTFYNLLDEAQVELEKALRIRPDFPEPAARMISVSLEQRDPENSPRHWFKKATAVQIDWGPAYGSLLRTMQPRWGGSTDQMADFGLECAATKRFDTDVPWQLLTCIDAARDEDDNLLENENVYQATKKVCQGYAAEAAKQGDQQSVRKYESYLAAAAFLVKKHEDIVAALERIDNEIDTDAFEAMRVTGQGLLGRSIARLSPAAELCEEVKQAIADGGAEHNDFAEKIRQLEELRDEVPSDGKLYVDALIDQAIAAMNYESGLWAEVKFEEGLIGWLRYGNWIAEPSTNSVLYTGLSCRKLLWSYPVEPPYVVEVKIEVIKGGSYVGDKAGIITGKYSFSENKGALFFIGGASGVAGYVGQDGTTFWRKSESTKVRRLRVHVWKDFHSTMVNNRFSRIIQDDGFDPTGLAGLGNLCGNPRTQTVRYSNFRIRKMNIGPPTEDVINTVEYWNQWLTAEPDNAHALAKRGSARGFESADDLDAAIKDLTASAKLDPHAMDTFLRLGAFYEEKAQFANAKASYLKAIEIRPHTNAIDLLATLEASCSDETLRDGESALKRAMYLEKLDPDNAYLDTLVASAWATIGDFDKAIEWQKKALKAEPESRYIEERRERLALYQAGKPFFYPPGPRTVVERTTTEPNPPKWLNPVITDGLIARWPFNSGVNEAVNELDSQIRNGVAKFRDQGKVDQALYLFDTAYVSTPDFGDFSRDDRFSYGGWVSPEDMKNGAVCSRFDDTIDTGHVLALWNKSVEFHLLAGFNGGQLKIKAKPKLNFNQWQHVFATYDGSGKADGAKIYINGEQVETVTLRDDLTGDIKNKAPFNIGLHSNPNRFAGRMDELRVYDRVLSPAEVAKVAAFGNEADVDEPTPTDVSESATQTPAKKNGPEKDEKKKTEDKVK